MEAKRVQALTIRINDNREFTILENKHKILLAKISKKYHNLLEKLRRAN